MSPTNDIMFSVLPVAAKAMITPEIPKRYREHDNERIGERFELRSHYDEYQQHNDNQKLNRSANDSC